MEKEKNKIKIATLGIADEFRKMDIGDIVHFPLDKYNYNTIRSAPNTSLVQDRLQGKKWKTKINYDERCVEVCRLS